MSEGQGRSVEERLRRLERIVEELRDALNRLTAAGAPRDGVRTAPRTPSARAAPSATPSPSPAPRRPAASPSRRPSRSPGPVDGLLERGPEFWVSRVGIGLLLVGVAFLFKYAVDKGWLTPWIRVVFGLGLGGTLAATGLRVTADRRRFGQIMLGGASATWYITGFAAYQLLELVSHPVAFGFMVLVTAFTFWTSVLQDVALLALLGAVGGLSTPFMLYTETGSIPGLVAYTLLLLVGTNAIYLVKGWRSLLWTTALGGWAVVMLALGNAGSADRLAVEVGLLGLWLLFWVGPTAREILAERQPERWPRPAADGWSVVKAGDDPLALGHVAVLVVALPVATLFASRDPVSMTDTAWGISALAGAVLYAGAAHYLLRHERLGLLVSAHRVSAAVLTIIAASFLFDGHAHLLVWTGIGLLTHIVATALRDRGLRWTAHATFAIVSIWLALRLIGEARPETAVFTPRALADLGVMALGVAASRSVTDDEIRSAYLLIAHGAVLAWLLRELSVLPGGDGVVTATWGVYGLALLLFLTPARRVGLATMFLAVGKLILFDLGNVDALLRILLFLGFGGVFLGLGYYFPAIWKSADGEEASPRPR